MARHARIRRVEKDPRGGWIARRRDGSDIMEPGFRWNSRAAARGVVQADDMMSATQRSGRSRG